MSDEKKDVNSQQENVGKKGINKKLIIAFAGMGAVIVGLVIALILVATSGKKDVDSSASKAESSSAVASETDDTSEEDSVADENEDEPDDEEEESKDDKKEKGFIISYSGDNSWQDGDKVMTGMEIGIENNSDEALKEWTLELEIDQLKSCDGCHFGNDRIIQGFTTDLFGKKTLRDIKTGQIGYIAVIITKHIIIRSPYRF